MKRLTLLLAAAATLALQPVPQSARAADEPAPYQQFTLPNGLRVIVHEDHNTPKVAVAVWYHVGSANEPRGKSGFAHLYEHLMFNGSEHHDKEYFPPLQEIGASAVNGATSLDQTYYYEIVPTGGLERALWLESDRMGHMVGAITQAKLDEQRAVVMNEKRTHENQPYALIDQLQGEGLFPENHPYHHSTIGSMDDLSAASLEDVKAWFGEYYGAANAVVTLSGDVTPEQARTLVGKYFGSVPAGPPTGRLTAWVPELDHVKTEVLEDNVPQTAIAWAWPVPGQGTAEGQALRMAAQVLGRGKGSRLYQALVQEQQIANAAGANYQGMAVAGVFSIDVRLKEGVDRATAEAAIDKVLRAFVAGGPTDAELARAKATSYGDMVRAMESIYVKAMALSDGAIFSGNPGQYLEDERAFAALTGKEVTATSAAWLGKPSYRLAVLPYGSHDVAAVDADRTALPPLARSPDLALPVVREARLSNGIRVVLSERPGTPVVEMVMVFDAGQAAEQHAKSGLQGFTLGLMDEGTRTLTSQELADRQAALGARIYGSADADTTNLALSALSRSLPESIALWADYIRNPGFRPADLERDRALHLSELSQSLVEPGEIAQRTYTHLLYGEGHAYGVALAGRAQTLGSIDRDDVVAFHESWIRPDKAVIYAAGDTDFPAFVAALENAFGDWRAPARPAGQKTIDPVARPAAPRVILVDRPGAIQSVIRVGEVMPPALDPNAFDLGAMNDVLGGSFTSRLNMNLREDKGWTYGAGSQVDEDRGPRAFTVFTSVQTDRTAEALAEIGKEIRAIRGEKPATPEELDLLAKGEVLALPGRFETNQAVVGYLQYVNRLDRPYDYISTLPDKYRALRPETITATAASLLDPAALTWVVVGDLAKFEPQIRALGLGEIEVWDAEGRKLR